MSIVCAWTTWVVMILTMASPPLTPPSVTIGPASEPPKIDGFLDDNAWRDAACVSGFITLGRADLSPLITVAYITFDDERLYLGVHAKIAGARPNAQPVERDGAVWGGDSVEVSIAPPWMQPGQYYHLIVNYHGSLYDMVKLDAQNARNFDPSWNGNWQTASNVWEGEWTLELSVPLEDLRVDDPSGDWRFNLGRSEGRYSAWSFTGRGYHNSAALGTVRFSRAQALRPRMDVVRGAKEGELVVAGELRNVGNSPRQATVTVKIAPVELALGARDDRLAQSAIAIEQTISVPANGTAPIHIEQAFEDRTLDLLSIAVRGDDGEQLYHAAIPFLLEPRGAITVIPHPAEDHAVVTVDRRRMKAAAPVDLRGEMRDADGRTIKSFSWDALAGEGDYFQRDFDLSEAPVGAYTFNFKLVDNESGRTLREESVAYERRQAPRWYTEGRDLGLPARVIQPWTPIGRDGAALRVWGRRYTLDQSPIFGQIESAGSPLLRAPISLEAVVGGNDGAFTFVNRRFTSEAGDAVAWTTLGRLGAVGVEINCTLEYDGMTRVDLTLRGDRRVTVDKLRLRLPMTVADSAYYHACRTYYDSAQAGYVPKDGLSMVFTPYLWLGSLKRGLMWFAESPRGWSIGNNPIRVSVTDAGRDLVVEFVQTPLMLDGERTFTFGLHPTPVKPLPEGWRGLMFGGAFEPDKRLDDDMIVWQRYRVEGGDRYGFWKNEQGELIKPGHTTPLKMNVEATRKRAMADAKRGIPAIHYHYVAGASPGRTTDFDRYVRNWEAAPGKQMSFGEWGDIHGACLGSTWSDFLLYGMKYEVEQVGLSGVYWDGGGAPSMCRNPLHDHGYLAGGRREGQYPIFDARNFMKRLATMYDGAVGPGKWIIWNHNSQSMPVPYLSHASAILDGESPFQRVRDGGPTFAELVQLDYMRVAGTGEHFGIIPTWLVYRRVGDPSVLRATYSVLVAHGTPIHPSGGVAGSEPDAQLTLTLWNAYRNFDIRRAEFVGYWDNADWLTVNPGEPEALVSIYARPGEAQYLLIVSNITKQPREVTVELAATKFKLTDHTARDLMRNESVTLSGRAIRTTVGPEDFRLIAIRRGDL